MSFINFEVVSRNDAEQVRESEVNAIHARYKKHEEYTTELQADSKKRRDLALQSYSRRIEHNTEQEIAPLPQTNNVLELIKGGGAKQTIQNLSESLKFHTDILKIEANLLSEETAN